LKQGLKVNQDGLRRSALELMAMPEIGFEGISRIWPEMRSLARADVIEALEAEALYSGYIRRQQTDIDALRREDQLALPQALTMRRCRAYPPSSARSCRCGPPRSDRPPALTASRQPHSP
jgi:tRNA U34 5-carboxymethylaminomethyl modifying enzyme MnmG/GidA